MLSRILGSLLLVVRPPAFHRELFQAVERWHERRLPTDFVVQEIDLGGTVAELGDGEDLWLPGREPVMSSAVDQREEAMQLLRDADQVRSSPLATLIGTEPFRQLLEFATKAEKEEGGGGEQESTEAKLRIPAADLDKNSRAEIHREIRQVLGMLVDSSTDMGGSDDIDDGGDGDDDDQGPSPRPCIVVWRRSLGGRSKGSGRWPPGLPEFLRFVVRKQKLTTLDTIEALAKASRSKPERFAYSGAKDRIALTSQFVTMWRPDLTRVIPQLLDSSPAIKVGRFELVDTAPRLGGLAGNRFEVT